MSDGGARPQYKALIGWDFTPEEEAVYYKDWPENVERVHVKGRSMEELAPILPEIDAAMTIPSLEFLQQATRIKLIIIPGHGIDFMKDPEMKRIIRERKIAVCKAQTANIPIAEHVIGNMINLSRRLFKFHESVAYRADPFMELKQQGWSTPGGELYHSTLGIVGFGAIGQAVAQRARGFEMTIGAVDLAPENIDCEKHGISFTATLDKLDEFLPRCNYVVLTLPLTPSTENCMNQARFDAMKDASYLINVSRGQLIDDEALYRALVSGKLAGAAIDVWRANVRQKGTYPFPYPIHHFNVIMTPHHSGGTYEAERRWAPFAVENMARLGRGEPLLHVANVDAGF